MESESTVRIIENVWNRIDLSPEKLSSDQQHIWRLLRCRYRLLKIKKVITDEQVVEFKHLVDEFERIAMCVHIA